MILALGISSILFTREIFSKEASERTENVKIITEQILENTDNDIDVKFPQFSGLKENKDKIINGLINDDAKPKDNHWTLSQLVNRRDLLVEDGIRFKNGLHEQVALAYPSYSKFFSQIGGKGALYFWKTYEIYFLILSLFFAGKFGLNL